VRWESVTEGWVQKFVEVVRSILGSLVHLYTLGKFRVNRSRL
jgi:hypothetical protein